MKVVVVGAGEVGFNIARSLSSRHEVNVVDIDEERVDEINHSIDALGIHGDGTFATDLEEAGVSDADILIASTDDDQANIVSALAAKTLGDPFTVVRVKRVEYLDTWNRNRGAFGVDHMICTDLQTAQVVSDLIGLPAARDVRSFAGGTVQMAEFTISPDSPIAGKTVAEADEYEELTFVAVFRDDRIEIVRGDTVLQADDSVVVIGPPPRVRECATAISGHPSENGGYIVVMGGSAIGYHLARQLQERGFQPRLVESDHDRAVDLAEDLPHTVVLNHDGLDVDFLQQENIDEADAVVAAFESDEQNLLCSLLVERLGADRTISITENTEYQPLFEAVGVDAAVTPRLVAAEEIVRFTWGGATETVAIIEHDAAEVLELVVTPESSLAHESIAESMAALPDGVVIGAITRDGTLLIPRGETVIEPNDHIVLFSDADVVDDVIDAI